MRYRLPLGSLVIAAAWHLSASGQAPLPAQAPPCVVTGVVTSGATPLPGVTLAVAGAGSSSTDVDGAFRLRVRGGAAITLRAEMMGFAPVERVITIAAEPACDQKVDLTMALAVRGALRPATPVAGAPAAAPGRAGGPGTRFSSLTLQPEATAQNAAPPDDPDEQAAARQLLPPGFSTEAATEAVTLAGNQGQIDRGMLNERMDAMQRGDFEPGMRQGGPGGGGPPGAMAEQLGRFGPGEGGGFGGRMGGAARLQGSATYTLGGSPLNAAPYSLRGETREEDDYLTQRFGVTLGGPVKIPGLYDGTRRTNFNFSYSGNRADDIFDTYSTVPSDAVRRGDFSSLLAQGVV
ncbi:MAG: carboxypeptidase-like regulatory domain-containing protein, partial [Acidobacteriota bacterium]|nr:carboxypeptidase-like regulatory domain-containing protein [Acidobacteriota bacterium]